MTIKHGVVVPARSFPAPQSRPDRHRPPLRFARARGRSKNKMAATHNRATDATGQCRAHAKGFAKVDRVTGGIINKVIDRAVTPHRGVFEHLGPSDF